MKGQAWGAMGKYILAALVIASLGLVRPARAEDSPEALIRQGVEMRRLGQDVKAHGYLKRAYELSKTPRAAAQLGLVEQALGRFFEARSHLAEALATEDPWVDEHRKILETSLATVQTHLGRVVAHGLPANATVAIGKDGSTIRPAPDGALWVSPGAVALEFAAPEHQPLTKTVTVAAGATVELDVDLPSVPQRQPAPAPAQTRPVEPAPAAVQQVPPQQAAPASEPSEDPGRRLRTAGWITGAAGLALGITGGVLYGIGVGKNNAIDSDGAASKPYNEANGNFQGFGYAGIALMAGGGAAVATGVVLYLLGRNAETGASVSVSYVPGQGGVLRAGGRF